MPESVVRNLAVGLGRAGCGALIFSAGPRADLGHPNAGRGEIDGSQRFVGMRSPRRSDVATANGRFAGRSHKRGVSIYIETPLFGATAAGSGRMKSTS